MIFIVTQTFPPRTGGMEGVMAALAGKLAAMGESLTVLPDRPHHAKTLYKIQQKSLPKWLRPAAKRLWLARHMSPSDTVICDSWKSVKAVPCGQARLIVLAHGQEYLKTGRRAGRVQKALDRASHIVAGSAYTLGLIRAAWDIDHVKARVIPPTYMLPDDVVEAAPGSARPLQLVSICRLEARKGLLQSLEALARLGGRLPEWCWSIGGAGPLRAELMAAIARYGLIGQVRLLGDIDEANKQDLLRQAVLFIMPGYQHKNSIEGFGISYVEAARYGVPSIAGTAGGAAEAVIDGLTGWCVDGRDRQALQGAILCALTHPDKRHQRGMAAQKRFVQAFGGRVSFNQFLQAIE